jgi:hypothetical protein
MRATLQGAIALPESAEEAIKMPLHLEDPDLSDGLLSPPAHIRHRLHRDARRPCDRPQRQRRPPPQEFLDPGTGGGRQGRAAGVLALGLGPLHPRLHPLGDQRALELGQARHDAEQELALRGGGVRALVVADEVNPEALELRERIDELAQGAGEAVVAPDQQHVELPPAGSLEHGAVLLAVVAGAAGVVDILVGYGEATPLGVLAQLPQLRLRVLPPVDR